MHPIKDYQFAPSDNELSGFSRGFVLAVVIILLFVVLIISGLVTAFNQITYVANARLVYLAAGYAATESMATGNYHVPIQSELIDLIGEEANQDAIIKVVDENRDGSIDYIVYTKNGLVTRYIPGDIVVTSE